MAKPTPSIPTDAKPGLTFAGKIRLRVFAYTVATVLAVWGAIALSPAWAMLPLVGVAVAAVTMTVNKVTARLARPTCWTCGFDLSAESPTPHGITCPDCGSLNLNPDPTVTLADADDTTDAEPASDTEAPTAPPPVA